METVKDMLEALGEGEVATALEVSEFSIRAAKRARQFPARWFEVIEGMCKDRALECPRALFAFKRESDAA